jgi:hypothetical protein
MMRIRLAFALSLVSVACSSGSASENFANGAGRQNHPVGEGTTSDVSPTEGTGVPGPSGSSPGMPASPTDAGPKADAGGGEGGAGDAGAADAGPANAFTGAAAFVATLGASTIKGAHPNGGNPAKADCLSGGCHGAGGNGPRFLAGGTVFTSAAATTPAAQVEVRLRNAAGVAVSTYTDANGNFFVRAGGATTLIFPANTGARNAAATRPMSATIADGACNSGGCHGGATGVIHVP